MSQSMTDALRRLATNPHAVLEGYFNLVSIRQDTLLALLDRLAAAERVCDSCRDDSLDDGLYQRFDIEAVQVWRALRGGP